MLLSACDDMHVHLYEANGNLIEAFSGHESWVLSVSAHADGAHFATGSSDGRVKLWDIPQRACLMTSCEHRDQVWSVAFNGDGSQIASCGDDGQVVTYNIQ
jgi:WD repeat-containing protein 61